MKAVLHRLLPNRLVYWLQKTRRNRGPWRRHRAAIRNEVLFAQHISSECLTRIESLSQWHLFRGDLQTRLADMLGFDALHDQRLLTISINQVFYNKQYSIEKLLAKASSGHYIRANYYRPKVINEKIPCVIYLCGHMAHPTGAKTQYQDRYLWYPHNGIACLVIDPHGFGEIPGIHHGTQELGWWEWISMGYTPAGLEVWNAMRMLDWLQNRPEIDTQHIAVTGISGGGVMSFLLGALDERIAVVAPSCSAFTIGSQAAMGMIPGQCDCTFYPNYHRIDFPEVAALIAPRPLLMTCGQKDRLFPPQGYRELHNRVKNIYALYDPQLAAERVRMVDSCVGHEDSLLFLKESRQWITRWLVINNNNGKKTNEKEIRTQNPAELVYNTPEELVDYSGNYSFPGEMFIKKNKRVSYSSNAEWQARRTCLLHKLSQTVFNWFPSNQRDVATRLAKTEPGYAEAYATISEQEIETEPGVYVRVRQFSGKEQGRLSDVLFVIRLEPDGLNSGTEEFLPLLRNTQIVVIYPRFSEVKMDARSYAEAERTAAISGRTIASKQIWDVLQVVRHGLKTIPTSTPTNIYGRGAGAAIAMYVALLEERLDHIILKDHLLSHRFGCFLLGILRHTDISEILATLAPRAMTCIPDGHGDMQFAGQIYKLLDAGHQLQTAASLAEACQKQIHRYSPTALK